MKRQMIAVGFAFLLPVATAVVVAGGVTMAAAAISLVHRRDSGR